jgi:hypothetical protein
MKILKKTQLFVVLLTACSLSFGAVEQPKNEQSQLKFTVSEEPQAWDATWQSRMRIVKQTHVAVFRLHNLREWGHPWFKVITRVKGNGMLKRVTFTEEGASTPVYEFLLGEHAKQKRGEFLLYATSEKEAREMAEALINASKNLADVKLRRAEAKLEDYRKKIADAENEIPKIEIEKKAAEAQFAECKKTTYYRNKDDAQRKEGIDHQVLWTLSSMQMAAEIELAGALARKNAALSHRTKALDFLDLAEKHGAVSAKLADKQNQLQDAQRSVEKYEARLPQLRADVRPVEVVDNEVVIHPVQ